MSRFESLSIVFPAYNEEDNIEGSVRQAAAVLETLPYKEKEIIVVDDGSVDRTGEILDGLKEQYPSLRVFHHKPNKGYGAALRTGFTNAQCDLVFYTDSDLQFDLRELKNFLPAIDDYDIVVGFRIYRYDPFNRLVLSWGYNVLMRWLFRLRTRDVDCAFKLFRRSVFDKIKIETDDFFVDAEVMAKARYHKFGITEIGVRHYPRKAGRSTIRPTHILTTLKELGKIWVKIHLKKEG
jgi:glycosyltransferase involved in cell wall biosynthesis